MRGPNPYNALRGAVVRRATVRRAVVRRAGVRCAAVPREAVRHAATCGGRYLARWTGGSGFSRRFHRLAFGAIFGGGVRKNEIQFF